MTILIGVAVAILIAILLKAIGKFLGPINNDDEKSQEFECGFKGFKGIREQVQIRFFLIGLLFVLFDLEIALIVPFSVLAQISSQSSEFFWILIVFIIILTEGLIWEYMLGALDWE